MPPRIITAGFEHENPQDCISAVMDQMHRSLDGQVPNLVIGFHTACDDNTNVAGTLNKALPSVPVIGCSSCQGAMTERGLFGQTQFGLGLWAIVDPQGAYGVGFVDITNASITTSEETPSNDTDQYDKTLVIAALQKALHDADRDGEQPDLIWIHTTPGYEEFVIDVLNDELGGHVPIVGGSSADQEISGKWHCFGNMEAGTNGLALAVLFPSVDIELTYSFQSGYTPTERKGRVTKAVGRLVEKIDGLPAAFTCNTWCEGAINTALQKAINTETKTAVLGETTLYPLGREIGQIKTDIHTIPYYTLIHPEAVTEDQGLALFAEVKEGDEVVQMTGSIDSLIPRAGRAVTDAIHNAQDPDKQVLGGLIIYCAGCRLAVGDQIKTVKSEIDSAIEHKPYITAFTFGEQGCLLGGENVHGNLMISAVVFLSQ